MCGIAGLPSEEREILFQNTAAKMGMNAAVIEKDFWVCLTFNHINFLTEQLIKGILRIQ